MNITKVIFKKDVRIPKLQLGIYMPFKSFSKTDQIFWLKCKGKQFLQPVGHSFGIILLYVNSLVFSVKIYLASSLQFCIIILDPAFYGWQENSANIWCMIEDRPKSFFIFISDWKYWFSFFISEPHIDTWK